MLDNSYTHKFYQRATRGVLRIFLHLLEFPEDVDGLGHLAPAQRKKEREKAKKAKKRAEEEKKKAEDEAAAAAALADGDDDTTAAEKEKEKKKAAARKDTEPDEEILLAKDFAAEAALWYAPMLSRIANCAPETIALVAEAAARRGEYQQAVTVLRAGLTKAPQDPHLALTLVRVAAKVKSPGKKGLGPSAPEIREAVTALLGCAAGQIDIDHYIASYSAEALCAHSLPMLLAAAKARVVVAQDKAAPSTVEAVSALFSHEELWQGLARGVSAANVLETVKVRIVIS